MKPGYYWARPSGEDGLGNEFEWSVYRVDADGEAHEMVEGSTWRPKLSGPLEFSHEMPGPPGTVHVTVHAGGTDQPLVGLEHALSATATRWMAEKVGALMPSQEYEIRILVST